MKPQMLVPALGLMLSLILAPMPALAHKVIAAVFAAGGQIEGEIGFSNGDMAKAAPIAVTDPAGRRLGETVTDDAGAFTFTPAEPVEHVFHADLGAGHVASVSMTAADVGKILGRAPVAPAAPTAAAPVASAPAPAADPEQLASLLRDELRPLRHEIAAYKEKNDLQTILGGMGYIAGLFGLGFYLAARRRLAAG